MSAVLVLLCAVGFVGAFPKDISRCRAGDTQCIQETSLALIKQFATVGYKDLGFPAIEPFLLKRFEISDGRQSSLSLKINFQDLAVSGLSDVQIDRFVGFTANAETSKFELYVRFPEIRLRGKYVADGRILILPIQGNGDADISLYNVKTSIKFKPKVVKKNGSSYLEVDKLKVLLEPQKMRISLTNLFNGDRILGENLNLFLNENWGDVWTELQPSIHVALAEIVKSVMRNIFKKFAYEEIFVD